MKFNWGHGISIVLVIFVVTVAGVVILISTDDTYNHELVSETYYEDELKYQEEIDKVKNASKLETKLTYRISKEGVLITFPSDFEYTKVSGIINMKRPSKMILDFSMPIKLDENFQMLIPAEKAIKGKWLLVIDWKVDEQEFMYKAKIRT
ncbi:MAG: FixH family protein [Flavobacteriales bacterium]|nr:FixH family protein [Flavobacteriales bacterium]